MASIFHAGADRATLLIELALSVVGYVSGAILGAFLLAAVPALRREAKGLEWSAALSILSIFAITRHETWATIALGVASFIILITSCVYLMRRDRMIIFKLIPFIALLFFLNMYHSINDVAEKMYIKIGWPWYATLGCLVMLSSSLLICEKKREA